MHVTVQRAIRRAALCCSVGLRRCPYFHSLLVLAFVDLRRNTPVSRPFLGQFGKSTLVLSSIAEHVVHVSPILQLHSIRPRLTLRTPVQVDSGSSSDPFLIKNLTLSSSLCFLQMVLCDACAIY